MSRVAFLFLGETLLIPHLFPIVEALAEARPELPIDLWVSTATSEALLRDWLSAGGQVKLRRAPGFGPGPGLPAKLPMLARLAPGLWRTPVAVCAEQTSLWLPTVLPMRTRFIKTSHGVGSMSARDDRRRRAAWKMLVPSELERETYLVRGFAPDRIVATGYVKASFRQRTGMHLEFAEKRPTLLYTPHWQRHRSSWWDWGRAILDHLRAQDRWNVIFAPHQRLIEGDPEVGEIAAELARLPHFHTDTDSFAMVDGSYTAAADLYLGDTSSQVVEFLVRPRPCVFLNSQALDWRTRDDHGFWKCGEVIDRLELLSDALDRAAESHAAYEIIQREFAQASLGDVSGAAPRRAADQILLALES